MPTLEFNDLAKIGVVKDTPGYMLPPEALTVALNVRGVDGGMERMKGWEQVFGTPTVAPHYALSLSTSAQTFWIYTSLTKAYSIDGNTHTNITRQTAAVDVNYTTGVTANWGSTIIGGIPVLNNATDVPQFWSPPAAATKMRDLTNWPATLRAKQVKAFGPHLIALNTTKAGTNYPHMVKWSAAVTDPGTVPTSWDETLSTTDAGEYELPDVNSGVLLDGLPLQSKFFLYKEGSVWAMRYIGGRFVFSFETFLETVGILAPRCATITGDGLRHVVATQDDIIVHNGNTTTSILDKRLKRAIFNSLDTTNYTNSFMFTNAPFKEVWFCYPPSGASEATQAVVWNYKDNTLVEVDGITFRNVGMGVIEAAADELWSAGTDVWDTDTGPWAETLRRKVILVGTDSSKFFTLDSGKLRDGVTFNATIQREGLSIIGKKRDGGPLVDHQVRKMVERLWPKMQGGPVRIRIGFQQVVDGSITWGDYVNFDPATGVTADLIGSGRSVAVEFSTIDGVDWRVDGYKMELTTDGMF